MVVHEDTRDLKELAQVDPDSILDRLNDNLQRKMPTYRDLYLRWERLNWSVAELDFSQDRKDWLALDDHHRERLLWTLAAFYVAEQRVAATLTPYVTAAPRIEQKIFLTTQCVDEARHTVFFDRWFDEVVAPGDEDLARRLRSGRQWVGPGFAPLFDVYLEDVAQQLRDDPNDVCLFAKAIAVYHIVIEGVLALTGQKFILAWARNEDLLPGFRAGFTAVARDESRHVSFGARVTRDLLDEDPSLIDQVHEGIREALRLGTALYQPPGGDVTYTSAFGYSLGDLFNYGGVQLQKKMRAIGAPMPSVDVYVPPLADAPWPPPGGGLIARDLRQRLTTGAIAALRKVAPGLAPGIGFMALYLAFDEDAAQGVDAVYRFDLTGRGGGVFHVLVHGGACRIAVGAPERAPDVIYEMEASTWAAMVQGLVTGDEAVLLGRLRIRGDVDLGRGFDGLFRPVGEPRLSGATLKPAAREKDGSRVRRVLRRFRPAA